MQWIAIRQINSLIVLKLFLKDVVIHRRPLIIFIRNKTEKLIKFKVKITNKS